MRMGNAFYIVMLPYTILRSFRPDQMLPHSFFTTRMSSAIALINLSLALSANLASVSLLPFYNT